MTEGMVRESKARFEPISDMKNPRAIAPISPPMQLIDPIHDTCSFVKGPETNGVFSDDNFAIAGDIQPMIKRDITLLSCFLHEIFLQIYPY